MFGLSKKDSKNKNFFSFARFGGGEEKKYFAENLAMLLSSGMDILSSLNAISDEVRSRKMKRIVSDLKEDIDSGSPVWRALENTSIMPAYIISLAKIGEKTGRLPENLKIIATQQQKDRSFHAKIASAMMYPIMVLSLTVVIGVGVAWFILPRLSIVFKQMRMELPWITKVLVAAGNFLGHYGFFVVPGVLLFLVSFVYFVFFFPKTKFIGQTLLFNFPGTKKMLREVELARAGYLLGTLLQAGVPIVDSLNSLSDATVFQAYKKFYSSLKESITEGNSFQRSFDIFPKSEKLIPASIKHMIVAGEQSGRLPETLLKIGEIFEEKTETTTKNFAVILEPILLVIVWVGVVMVALAVILPIYSLIGGLNQATTSAPPVALPATEQKTEITNQPAEEVKTETPSAESAQTENPEQKLMLEILPTETGFLNIRDQASKAGKIIGKVKPGEQYEYTEQKDDWYHIILSDGKDGWVLGKYVKIISGS